MRGGEGRLTASRDAPVGGQAVLEGVMMRGITTWAVAVRKPAVEEGSTELGPIAVQSFPLVSWTKRHRFYRLPVIRGVVALAESLAIGLRALGISANAQLPEDEQEISGGSWVGMAVGRRNFGVREFFVVPVARTGLVRHQLTDSILFSGVEGVLRTS